jgi:hypothetical protein
MSQMTEELLLFSRRVPSDILKKECIVYGIGVPLDRREEQLSFGDSVKL